MPSAIDYLDRVANRAARIVPARKVAIEPARSIVSFTFDDAPASSLVGASILEQHGVRGTFYIAGGLAGAQHDGQTMLSATQCKALVARGHELGCHTFSHQTPRKRMWSFPAELDRNAEFFSGVMDTPPQNFAFPYGLAAPWMPGPLGKRFRTSRGVASGINRHDTNLDKLMAVEIRPDAPIDELTGWIDGAVVHPGWVIYFTHDVSDAPSPFGSTPATLDRLVSHALELGCEVLTIDKALDRMGIAP